MAIITIGIDLAKNVFAVQRQASQCWCDLLSSGPLFSNWLPNSRQRCRTAIANAGFQLACLSSWNSALSSKAVVTDSYPKLKVVDPAHGVAKRLLDH